MPPKKSRAPRRKVAKRARRAPRRRVGRSSNVSEHASCSVKVSLTDPQGNPFLVNRMYESHNVRLVDYARAVQIAQGYQFFRIKKIGLTYKLGYDTYQAVAGGPTRPNFYYMLDKSQSIPNTITLDGLKQMGARPRRCDEKPLVIAWSPSVLTEEQTLGGPTAAQYKISPWLNTNNNNLGAWAASLVQHNGIYWYIQMDATAGVGYQYTVEMEVQFEFKKPLWTQSVSVTPALGTKIAEINSSPDGLVGGADEETPSIYSLTGTSQQK